MWSYGAIKPSSLIEIASEDNAYEKLSILWRHVKSKNAICVTLIISFWLKCLIFLVFDLSYAKLLQVMDKRPYEEILFLGKYAVFSKNESEMLKNSDFCYTWSNDYFQ